MPDPYNDTDEVALNVLLDNGVDLPTALEASRRDTGDGHTAATPGCLVAAAVIVALVIALRLWF